MMPSTSFADAPSFPQGTRIGKNAASGTLRRTDWRRTKTRAQPIGISAAPNLAGQARGEGGKDGRSATTKRDSHVCSGPMRDVPCSNFEPTRLEPQLRFSYHE